MKNKELTEAFKTLDISIIKNTLSEQFFNDDMMILVAGDNISINLNNSDLYFEKLLNKYNWSDCYKNLSIEDIKTDKTRLKNKFNDKELLKLSQLIVNELKK